MKPCILIPCYNHASTIAAVASAAQIFCPVIVVDDGSTLPLPELPNCTLLTLKINSGKGAALAAGFRRALELGFTHAITMDSDGQHFAEDLPKFLEAVAAQPDAFIVGVRDLVAAGCPKHRQRSNAVSSFWFRVETGIRLRDTQCGFRSYPLALVEKLKIKSGRYAFELEFMVRAAWIGTSVVAVPVKCTYVDGIRNSHFRPVKDLAHITFMNIGLVLQSWFVPRTLRVAWSCGKKFPLRKTAYEFFTEHAHDPLRMSLAVGLGLFFGIVPLWGIQMATVAAVAHLLRLNKAIALVASNISFGPAAPFIIGIGLIIGHWMFTGEVLKFPPPTPAKGEIMIYVGQCFAGSVVLGVLVAVPGTIITYLIARTVKHK
jgi:glycosyltransferase involved in cell wall biosynthesis